VSVPLLQGVRVLDLTNVLAGPFAGYQLALLGADVLKVESPHGGDLARQLGADPDLSREHLGASFLAQNAGKRSIALDLKDDHDRAAFTRLVADYDVVLENFRPGVMDRLGFGWDAIRTINPAAIYCAVSGFGQTGPMRDRPAYDQIIQGLSGLMSVTGTAETSPIRVGVPICDSIGGLVAAFAICAALVRRAETGEGAFLDVSMLEAAIASMGWVVSDQLIAERDPRPMANENPTSAPSGTFDTADGKLNIAANKQEQFEALCGVLRRPDLLADSRFATRDARKQHRDELREELEKSLTQKTAQAWDEQLTRGGVPAAPVVTVREALESEQIRARGLIHTVASPSPRGGRLRLLGSPVHVDGEAIGPGAPPPVLGADTAAVLAEFDHDTRKRGSR
jgi:crotonobetainyl-CoA:carnitine CoA-transferase CaiB-like acyl-CoA transferase